MNSKRKLNLTYQEKIDLIYYLTDKGFAQQNISALFGNEFSQTKISILLKERRG
jgi:hypothetical protein